MDFMISYGSEVPFKKPKTKCYRTRQLNSPPLEKKVYLPVRKNFFDAALKRCSEDHFYMSFSSRKCISGQN